MFLNNVVASLLLQHDEATYNLKDLVADCSLIYKYMQARGIATIMHTAPNKSNIERVLAGLGYKIVTEKTNAAIKNVTQNVNLSIRENFKELLGLYYYNIGYMQHMVMDVVIGKVLTNLGGEPICIDDLDKKVALMSHIFRNEYVDREEVPYSQMVRTRIETIAQFGGATFNEQTGKVSIADATKEGKFLLNHLQRMGHYIANAYLIVLYALEDISEANHVISETKLVNELHQATLQMYKDNLIKEMPSCLKELMETALRRFGAMGIAEIKHYTTPAGSSISFISCSFKNLGKIEELKLQISALHEYTPHEQQVIADRTQQAINNSLVQHLVAKL